MELLNHVQYGEGRDIIFLHGWGGDMNSIKPLADAFSDEFRVTLVDFYGFGGTPHPKRPLKLEDYALAVEEIIKHYGMNGVILVGHSFGGKIALLLSYIFAPHLDAVILIDSSGMKPRRKAAFYIKILINKIKKRIGRPVKGSKDYEALSGAMRSSFVNIVNRHLDGTLKHITAPVFIVWGKNDKETPLYMAKRLKKGLINSSLEVFDGGHFPYLDSKNEVISAVKDFLRGENVY